MSQDNCKQHEILSVSVPLTSNLRRNISNMLSDYDLSMEQLVQCAWALLLGMYQGTNEVVVGITSSGRSGLDELINVPGCFIRTLPLRVLLKPEKLVKEWISDFVRKEDWIFNHEHISLAKLSTMAHLMPGELLFNSVVTSGQVKSLGIRYGK